MGGDECAHAFAVPDDFGVRVAFLDELGEGFEVLVPVLGVSDVAAAFADGVAALAADFVGVESGFGLVFEEVEAEVFVVDGCAAEAVDADDDDVLFDFGGDPLAVAEGVAFGGGGFLGVVDEGVGGGAGGGEKDGCEEAADERPGVAFPASGGGQGFPHGVRIAQNVAEGKPVVFRVSGVGRPGWSFFGR